MRAKEVGMDQFLSELLNLGAIVRTVILGGLCYFLFRAVDRYLSWWNASTIQRRIKQAEIEKVTLDNLAKSDRSVLFFSFRIMFVVLALISFAFIIPVLSLFANGTAGIEHFLILACLITAVIAAMYGAVTLKKAESHPESIETIEKKIDALKERLSKLIHN